MKEEALIEMKTVEQELIAFDNQLYHYRGIVANFIETHVRFEISCWYPILSASFH